MPGLSLPGIRIADRIVQLYFAIVECCNHPSLVKCQFRDYLRTVTDHRPYGCISDVVSCHNWKSAPACGTGISATGSRPRKASTTERPTYGPLTPIE